MHYSYPVFWFFTVTYSLTGYEVAFGTTRNVVVEPQGMWCVLVEPQGMWCVLVEPQGMWCVEPVCGVCGVFWVNHRISAEWAGKWHSQDCPASLWGGEAHTPSYLNTRELQSGFWMSSLFTEPSARAYHFSFATDRELWVYGGDTVGWGEPATKIYTFNTSSEAWVEATTGESDSPPPQLRNGACTSSGYDLYIYGGYDGSHYHGSLYQLDCRNLKWTKFSGGGPRAKWGCGMIPCEGWFWLFGGRGAAGPTNELHVFDLKKGEGITSNDELCCQCRVVIVAYEVQCCCDIVASYIWGACVSWNME